MKKLNKVILFFFSCLIYINVINALEVSDTNIELEKGENKQLELYTTLEEATTSVSFNMTYTSYDAKASFRVNSQYSEVDPNSNTHTINFTEPVTGNILLGTITISISDNPTDDYGSVNLTNPKYINTNNEEKSLSTSIINVKINLDNQSEENKCEEKTNLLSKIDSSIVKIKLEKNKYEYEIDVLKTIDELDLKPIAIDDTYKVEISNQKITELVDNTITIKVSDDCNSETYKIKVNIKEEEKVDITKEIEIDTTSYKPDDSYKSTLTKIIIVLSIILVVSLIITPKRKR